MEQAKPVVLTKPVRGREMLSKKGPIDKVAPVEAVQPDKKGVETYYEGYVDGQLFLVPDSNLEAMKDMINFKMRPKTSIRYKHQTSYDIQYYDQFTEKLNELLSKIDDFKESGDFERLKPTESSDKSSDEELNSVKSEEKPEIKNVSIKSVKSHNSLEAKKSISKESEKSRIIEEIKSEIIEELEKEYVPEDEDSLSSSESTQFSTQSEKSDEHEINEETSNDDLTDEVRVRFLISGHLRDGEEPIYIVQEYDGKNDIFKDQKLDFMSFKKDNNTNVFIAGKMYSENILFESEGQPSFLNTKPDKIIINEKTSIVFNDYFEYKFAKGDRSILVRGKFIKGDKGRITPSLAFTVKEENKSRKTSDSGDNE